MLQYLRNTKLLVLALLVVLGIVMGVAHSRARTQGHPLVIENSIRIVVRPLQMAFSGVIRATGHVTRNVRPRSAILKENQQLRTQVVSLKQQVDRLTEQAAEAKRLRAALGFKQRSADKLLATRIISRNPSEWFITATIDRGKSSGIVPGQAVVTPWGFLGQVVSVSSNNAQIRAATDKDSGVGAMVQRSRAVGMCLGQMDPENLSLTYLAKDADIKPGDVIITSGQGGVVPKGLTIGRVIKVEPESGGFTKSAVVRPSVRLDRAEEVFVVQRSVE